MGVRIRLKRMGKKKAPFYRVVVADVRSPRDGRFIETIGTYDPAKEGDQVILEEDRALEWLRKGATPSDTVRSLFSRAGIMKKFDEERTASESSE